MESGAVTWTCVYTSDAYQKKRKRWTDGKLKITGGVVMLLDEAGTQSLGSLRMNRVDMSKIDEDVELRLGRYTVQIAQRILPPSDHDLGQGQGHFSSPSLPGTKTLNTVAMSDTVGISRTIGNSGGPKSCPKPGEIVRKGKPNFATQPSPPAMVTTTNPSRPIRATPIPSKDPISQSITCQDTKQENKHKDLSIPSRSDGDVPVTFALSRHVIPRKFKMPGRSATTTGSIERSASRGRGNLGLKQFRIPKPSHGLAGDNYNQKQNAMATNGGTCSMNRRAQQATSSRSTPTATSSPVDAPVAVPKTSSRDTTAMQATVIASTTSMKSSSSTTSYRATSVKSLVGISHQTLSRSNTLGSIGGRLTAQGLTGIRSTVLGSISLKSTIGPRLRRPVATNPRMSGQGPSKLPLPMLRSTAPPTSVVPLLPSEEAPRATGSLPPFRLLFSNNTYSEVPIAADTSSTNMEGKSLKAWPAPEKCSRFQRGQEQDQGKSKDQELGHKGKGNEQEHPNGYGKGQRHRVNQQGHTQGVNAQEQKIGAVNGSGEKHVGSSNARGAVPYRTVCIPNAFENVQDYRHILALAVQEELQLNLLSTTASRYFSARAELEGGQGVRRDHRDPAWNQKFYRGAGVAYYGGVSIIRAGKGRGRGKGSGSESWGGWNRHELIGKKRKGDWGRGRMGGESSDDEGGDQELEETGGLFLKVCKYGECKEGGSAYGKGDVWALSHSGKFEDAHSTFFCRTVWYGISSQGMVAVEAIGDEHERLRLEGVSRGGANPLVLHAIRCFNAQTELSVLDLLREGWLVGEADGAGARDSVGKSSAIPTNACRIDTIPVLQNMLLGVGEQASWGGGGVKQMGGEIGSGGSFEGKGARLLRSGHGGALRRGLASEKLRQGVGLRTRLKTFKSSKEGPEGREEVFQLSVSDRERDEEVKRTILEFHLNTDQASLLRHCARWFRTVEEEDVRGADGEADGGRSTGTCVDRGCKEEQEVHGEDDEPRKGEGGGEVGREQKCDSRWTGRELPGNTSASGTIKRDDNGHVVLVHGVFGAGKSLTLVALCMALDRICVQDAEARRMKGLPPRRRQDQPRVLVAAATNVAVDRILMGLVKAGFTDIARVGSHRKVHKSLLPWVVLGSPGRDVKQTAQKDLGDLLKGCSNVEERAWVKTALDMVKGEGFTQLQAKRLHEARVTGVTCASSTLEFLTRPAPGHGQPGIRLGGGQSLGGRSIGGGRTGGGGGGYDIVLLDECSQMVEPVSLLPLTMAQPRRLVLVGDPMQLPPAMAHAKVSIRPGMPPGVHNSETSNTFLRNWIRESNAKCGNDDCLEKTLFVRLAHLGLTPLLLGRQYRCHPTVSSLASRLFYQGRLSDGVDPSERPAIFPGLGPITLLDAAGRGSESTAAGGSVRNTFEARYVAEIVARLLGKGFYHDGMGGGGEKDVGEGQGSSSTVGRETLQASNIGVICLYKAQLSEVRRQLDLLSHQPALMAETERVTSDTEVMRAARSPRDVQVSTVDAFQGAEKDIIILASTRTERLGFIISPQRLCVALTRARHHLIVIGEKQALLTSPLWKEVVEAAHTITHVDEIGC